ncbi:sensor domain CHASE-containing protein [Thermosipho japonicus]|uniref:Sensor domain CHASE-containing protein n=1 Tax=Thermosipho japonicus TaxID=90323 RepID=A0A841GQK5_9BACT|nr:hypothetical protein [Thermosipho japonicus]MBB6061909.1 sensor domain CHASE-containing protein [Thermosipho japonicus]
MTITVENVLTELKKVNEYMKKLQDRKKELIAILEENIERPVDKNTLNLEGAKIKWITSAKISNTKARELAEKYPGLVNHVFSVTYKPKLSALNRIQFAKSKGKLPKDIPEEAVEEVLKHIELEERMSISFEEGGDNE